MISSSFWFICQEMIAMAVAEIIKSSHQTVGIYLNTFTASSFWVKTSVANLAVFPQIWTCFFVDLRFFEDLRAACFWACFD